MRGSPYLQAIFMVFVCALAGVPVWRLTRPALDAVVASSVAMPPPETANAKIEPLDFEVEFAPAPADFRIKNLDQTVLAGHGPQTRFRTRWAAGVPSEGADFVVQAHWPGLAAGDAADGAAPSAARLTVRFADGRRVEKSFWAAANGSLEEVFTLPGADQAPTP